MAMPTTRADRVAAIAAADPPVRDADDLVLLDAFVTAIDDGLARLDADTLLGPGEQLATLAVAGVRALAPLLRVQLDESIAAAEAKLADRKPVMQS